MCSRRRTLCNYSDSVLRTVEKVQNIPSRDWVELRTPCFSLPPGPTRIIFLFSMNCPFLHNAERGRERRGRFPWAPCRVCRNNHEIIRVFYGHYCYRIPLRKPPLYTATIGKPRFKQAPSSMGTERETEVA